MKCQRCLHAWSFSHSQLLGISFPIHLKSLASRPVIRGFPDKSNRFWTLRTVWLLPVRPSPIDTDNNLLGFSAQMMAAYEKVGPWTGLQKQGTVRPRDTDVSRGAINT
jgi:hypothetical protein